MPTCRRLPITWPTALSLSIPVASFASFFAIVVAIMSKMFHLPLIKTGKIKLPNVCFDKNTSFHMYNDTVKKISDVEAGDILADGTKITAKMKLGLFNTKMFSLQGIIVSESHLVKYNDKWIRVVQHPDAKEIIYNKEFLYCLNTTSKVIIIKDYCFTDWDEIYNNAITKFNTLLCIKFNNCKQ